MSYTNYFGNMAADQFESEAMRRQRELAAEARGERLDEIHEIILRQVRRMNSEQVAFERLAHDIRQALALKGYKIVPA